MKKNLQILFEISLQNSLIFCYICYDIFIFYFHKAIIVLCANISQVSNPSKQQSFKDLVHYLTKNRCSLSSERKEENTGLSIIVLLVSFAQISFPACAWPGLRYLMFVRSYFIVCLCVYLTHLLTSGYHASDCLQ